jgi:hypothetical protein
VLLGSKYPGVWHRVTELVCVCVCVVVGFFFFIILLLEEYNALKFKGCGIQEACVLLWLPADENIV